MKRTSSIALLALVLLLPGLARSVPPIDLNVAATCDVNGRGYLEVPDAWGGRARTGWVWQLIRDGGAEGLAPPSLAADSLGLPTEGDVLVAQGVLGQSDFVTDTLASVAWPYTFPSSAEGRTIYLRVFGADTLAPGTPFTETPAPGGTLEEGLLRIVDISPLPYSYGGLMTNWLAPEGISWVGADRVRIDSTENRVDLSTGHNRATLQLATLSGGLGVRAVSFHEYTSAPPRWNLDGPAFDRILTVAMDAANPAGNGWQATLTVNFSADNVSEQFGGEYAPSEMRLYREEADGWRMETEIPMETGEGYSLVLNTSERPFFGRWTIAPEGLTGVQDDSPERITDYRLYPAYPSPFNPSTRIRLDLPKASRVRMEVFNVLGRRVTLIQDGVLPAGAHTFTFSGNRLASGTYFLRVRADRFHAVQKMVLLR